MIQDKTNDFDDLNNDLGIDHEASFCVLTDYGQAAEALIEILECSKNKIKKFQSIKIGKVNPSSDLETPVNARSEIKVSLNLLNHKEIFPRFKSKVNVIYEDHFFLVLNKPSRMHSVPHTYLEKDNLLSTLRGNRKYARLMKTNYPDLNRGLLNRLDYNTSGVIIFVKDLDILMYLRENFQDTVTEKTYYAWLEGNLNFTGKVKGYLRPFGPGKEMVKFSEEEVSGSVYSESEFNTKFYDEKRNRTFTHIQIRTGARHQIRVHAQHLGHPVLGDNIYGNKSYNRLLLHAYRYVLKLNSRIYSFRAPCPFEIPPF